MNKSLFHLLALSFLGLSALTVTGCDKDNDEGPDNEEELITTVVLAFTNGAQVVTATWQDLDGPGGNAPEIDPITLNANTTYVVVPAFLNEAASPVENITEEVEAESNEHLVCWATTGNLTGPTAQDQDDNGDPLGLVNSLTTGNAGAATLTLRLKHEADKDAANPCNTGETDVEVTFPVTIQ